MFGASPGTRHPSLTTPSLRCRREILCRLKLQNSKPRNHYLLTVVVACLPVALFALCLYPRMYASLATSNPLHLSPPFIYYAQSIPMTDDADLLVLLLPTVMLPALLRPCGVAFDVVCGTPTPRWRYPNGSPHGHHHLLIIATYDGRPSTMVRFSCVQPPASGRALGKSWNNKMLRSKYENDQAFSTRSSRARRKIILARRTGIWVQFNISHTVYNNSSI